MSLNYDPVERFEEREITETLDESKTSEDSKEVDANKLADHLSSCSISSSSSSYYETMMCLNQCDAINLTAGLDVCRDGELIISSSETLLV